MLTFKNCTQELAHQYITPTQSDAQHMCLAFPWVAILPPVWMLIFDYFKYEEQYS